MLKRRFSFATLRHEQRNLLLIDADHRLAQILGQLRNQLGIAEIGDSLHNGSSTFCRVAGFENTGAYEYALGISESKANNAYSIRALLREALRSKTRQEG